jgi:hypothetical protein
MLEVTLEIHICDQRRSYLATFCTEEQVMTFIERKMDMNHAFYTVPDSDIPDEWMALQDFLWPTCEHGLMASNCSGPMHY